MPQNEGAAESARDVTCEIMRPSMAMLPAYVAALEGGWSPDNLRHAVAGEQLAHIERDPEGFLAGLDDPEAKGPPMELPNGLRVPRLPGFRRWIWDGEFCGTIGLRWPADRGPLPPHVLGHIGYTIIPSKRRRGYATRALGLMLGEARRVGLSYVELTTDTDNDASQKVILANGGVLVERFVKHEAYGMAHGLRFRIELH
ncbi:GNAT family N-acetyltransferase [Acetobacteraceae bacterium H6797]|nr:GNAT family N-acetyltransferase [Acetobacteraceae bacterium H6797]